MDIRLAWDTTFLAGDIAVDGADLATDATLETAVLVSLFTDRRAGIAALPAGETDPRGWWGDALSDDDPLGSHLWLLAREKQTAAVLVRAETAAREALAWLLEDGLATAVAVTATWVARGRLALAVAIDRRGLPPAEYQFVSA